MNTSTYEGKFQMLEIFRYFRSNYFKNIDHFYSSFFEYIEKNQINNFFKENKKLIEKKLKLHTFYSTNDVKFRLIRDNFLNQESYFKIMKKLFREKKFKINNFKNKLYFSKYEIKDIEKKGHIIGLYSHNHPTRMDVLSTKQQFQEYKKNQIFLSQILKKNL